LFTHKRKAIYNGHLEGLRVTVVALSARRELLWEQVHLPLALREHRIDVYHAPADQGFPAVKVCRYVLTNTSVPNQLYFSHMLKTRQLPGTIDDYLGDLRPSHPVPRGLYLRARGIVLRWLSIRRADRIITISETTKRELMTLLGVPEKKLRVTHLAPEPAFREPVSKDAVLQVRQKYGLPERYLLSVSTVARLKNTSGLIEAYAVAKRAGVDATLVLCSHVSYQLDSYRNLAREMGLQENRDLFFLDKVPDEDLRRLYRGASAFVLLSWYEAFSFPVVEAMASGTPVIASNMSCLPETVGDGGLLVDPRRVEEVALTIKRVLEDDKLRQDLRERALRRSRYFSWEKTAQQTLAVYNELVCVRQKNTAP
jgi:glycosyltransferase involved in cell wall biosynthesis